MVIHSGIAFHCRSYNYYYYNSCCSISNFSNALQFYLSAAEQSMMAGQCPVSRENAAVGYLQVVDIGILSLRQSTASALGANGRHVALTLPCAQVCVVTFSLVQHSGTMQC